MTVPTIGGIPAEAKRALEQQNRPAQTNPSTPAKESSARASDSIATRASGPAIDTEAAIIQTQAQNREAARATLRDEDFALLETQASPAERIAANPKAATAAQTSKLPVDLVQLAAE